MGGLLEPLFTTRESMGNYWQRATLPPEVISAKAPFQLIFRASVGQGSMGDIAIDDIVLSSSCQSVLLSFDT